MIIDIHAHYFPAACVARFMRHGGDVSYLSPSMLGGGEPHEIEARLAAMHAAGVQMQVLSVSSMFPYFAREDDAVAAACEANDLYAELVARYPDRFRAFAVAPLPHVDAAVREVERAFDRFGMAGVTIGASVAERSAVDPAFDPFFAELNRRDAVVFIHPTGLGCCSPLITEHRLGWTIGAPFEDTVFAVHAIQRQVPLRYPRLKIVVPHLGGALPMLLDRVERTQRLFAPDHPEPASVTARRLWYDTQVHGCVPALRYAHATYGADRLVLGTDYPLTRAAEYPHSVAYLRKAGLPGDDAQQILDRNAATVLGLA